MINPHPRRILNRHAIIAFHKPDSDVPDNHIGNIDHTNSFANDVRAGTFAEERGVRSRSQSCRRLKVAFEIDDLGLVALNGGEQVFSVCDGDGFCAFAASGRPYWVVECEAFEARRLAVASQDVKSWPGGSQGKGIEHEDQRREPHCCKIEDKSVVARTITHSQQRPFLYHDLRS